MNKLKLAMFRALEEERDQALRAAEEAVQEKHRAWASLEHAIKENRAVEARVVTMSEIIRLLGGAALCGEHATHARAQSFDKFFTELQEMGCPYCARAEVAVLLERVRKVEAAAGNMVNNLPPGEIEIAREAWGNTNTALVYATLSALADAVAER